MHPFPFFLGRGRSGTTLLRAMFDAHPDMAIPHESHFVVNMGLVRDRYEKPGGFDVDAFLDDLRPTIGFNRWKLPEEDVRRALVAAPPADYP
ncbi:MAG: sulfotransferase, partial [Actinomycetota bacterium]|nr:sulfotransferase [Actinomycetota bacterium]